jgi:hypothetical protein
VLHIDERGVEAGEPDQLDDLRVGDTADMGAERETAPSRRMRLTRLCFITPSLGSPR